LRLGYTSFVVDPNVRLAYEQRDARDAHKPAFVKGIRPTDWADVTAAPPIDWSLTPLRPYYKCCGLPPGHDMIEFDKDCKWDNFMSPNFTAARPYARSPRPVSIETAAAARWQVEAAAAKQQKQPQQPKQQTAPVLQQQQRHEKPADAAAAKGGQEWPAFRGE
jgi:hypothetical protein